MDAMLRKALRSYSGLRQQVDNVLLGDEGDVWEAELKKFLAKRPCWASGQKKTVSAKKAVTYTRSISDGHTIMLPANDGTRTITQASDVFAHIDSDFKNWNLDGPSSSSVEMPVTVREMIENGDFKTIFCELGNIARLCPTQGQIVDFARLHKEWLRTEGYGTFFLFRKGEEIPLSFKDVFVASVGVSSDGGLKVHVDQFLDDCVWNARGRHRLVVPQLTL